MSFKERCLRALPAVDKILCDPLLMPLEKLISRKILVKTVQDIIAQKRNSLLTAESGDEASKIDLSDRMIVAEAMRLVKEKLRPSLSHVINATGIVLHTNLGRAPLAPAAVERLQEISSGYSNLEFSLKKGRRSSRHEHVEQLLCTLTGAEAAVVVNNNAAAVYIALNTFAAGKEVIVARGQLVEIGGSFRIPEVMKASGAHLVEVGTTNKCYLSDYEQAINEETALLLKVHTSNYRVVGFTSGVSIQELVTLGRKKNVYVIEDSGSGTLVDFSSYGLPEEPLVAESVAAGVDLVTFSGDKLLGGPQGGIIAGKKDLVKEIKKNQMARVLRVDKLTLAALEATLHLYLKGDKAMREIPVLRMILLTTAELCKRAQSLAVNLQEAAGEVADFRCEESVSYVGGGAAPLTELSGYAVAVSPFNVTVDDLADNLRAGSPSVIARIESDLLILDPRTLMPRDEHLLVEAVAATLGAKAK